MHNLEQVSDRVILVGVALKSEDQTVLEYNLDELSLLAESSGCEIVGVLTQRLERIVPSTYLGSGKIQEIAKLKDETAATRIIVDAKLSGVQQRNIQNLVGAKVLDRTQLILEIFAKRAQTREGKLQVELAILKDQLPRLIGEAIAGLSRLGGGIGTRGPGETKLEMDRRQIQTRIEQVTKELEAVRKTRGLHRNRRKTSRIQVIALAGYTNAGKSTLLNRLTKAQVYTENKLFATLDPTSRRLHLPSGTNVIVTDTVGFINNLPHHLVDAFKATFEEVAESNLILHVHDASHPRRDLQAETVTSLLKEIGAEDIPTIHVYNKIDLARNFKDTSFVREQPFVNISALTGEGIDQLIAEIENFLNRISHVVDLYLPTNDPKLVYDLSRDAQILFQETGEYFTRCQVKLSEQALQKWSPFLKDTP